MSIYSKLALPAAIIVIVVVGVTLYRGDNGEKVTWHHTLPEALAAAKTSDTLILVDFHADWCGWCTKLDQDTLSNPEVQTRLKDFTLLKIDTDRYPDIGSKYGVTGLPTTAVLDASGKALLSQAGYMGPKDYMQFLSQVAR